MRTKQKIIITDEISNKINGTGASVDEVLSDVYREEIRRRRLENPGLANVSPIRMAMTDFGFTNRSTVNDIITTSGAGEWLLPAYIDQRLRETVIGNDTLQYLASNTIAIDGLSVVAAYLDLNDKGNKENIKMARVATGADLPVSKIKIGETSVMLTKKGRAVEATYESLQYMRLDMLSKTIEAIGNSVAHESVGEGLDVLVNGDGNDNPINSSLTTATANVITPDEIIDALIEYQDMNQGIAPTTIFAGKTFFKQLFKMFSSTDQVAGINRYRFEAPQFGVQTINLVYDSRVPQIGGKDTILILNSDFALQRYLANNSQVRELANNIRNQTRLGTISERSGFAKYLNSAAIAIKSK